MTYSLNFGIVSSHNVMIPMRDGVRLATDVYRPADDAGNVVEGRFPVIVGRTSYDQANPVIWIEAVAKAFVPRGYGVVLQVKVLLN
jgi:uncharacterized protein